MEPVILRTENLVLRPPDLGDVDAITEACQDSWLQRWVPVPAPYARSDAEGFVTHMADAGWRSGSTCTWAIDRAGELAGVISLNGISAGSASIGYWTAKDHRGTGVITAAGRRVLDFAFVAEPHGLGLTRIEWRAFTGNRASAAVARRLGFAFEGTVRRGGVLRGRRMDEWMAGILDTDDRSPREWPV